MNRYFKTLDRISSDSIKFRLAENACHRSTPLVFSIADSDYETSPQIKEALISRVSHGAFGYISLQDRDFQTVIDWFKDTRDLIVNKEQLLFTPSVLNSLSAIIQLYTEKNDKVLIQTPAYTNFKKVIEQNERVISINKLIYKKNSYKVDFSDLEEQFKKGIKLMILCSPHNPIGRVWDYDEIEKTISLAKKYNVLIVSDEIHADFMMVDKKFVSVGQFGNFYQHMFVLSSIGKTFNVAGLHSANVITFNEENHKKLENFFEALHLSTPDLLGLTVLNAAYNSSKEWVHLQNQHIYQNYLLLKQCIDQYPNLDILPLEATYLAWIKLDRDSTEFVKYLHTKCLCVSDGKEFLAEGNFIRMSLACSTEQLEKGIKVLDQALSKLS